MDEVGLAPVKLPVFREEPFAAFLLYELFVVGVNLWKVVLILFHTTIKKVIIRKLIYIVTVLL